MKQQYMHRNWLAGLVMAAGACLSAAPLALSPSAAAIILADEEDSIILKAGNVEIVGEIVSETDKTIKFKGRMAGIMIEKEFDKADILTIKRGKKADGAATPAAPANPGPATPGTAPAAAPKADEPVSTKTRIYFAELTGEFGVDISETPIRRVVKEARALNAEVIIFSLENKIDTGNPFDTKFSNDMAQPIDELFRAENITPIFVEEIPRDWGNNKPKVVFWVKQALGGAALLPLCVPNVYMSSTGRIGGTGYLAQQVQTVDAVVAEKLRSARLGHAKGWVAAGGYDERLVSAMCLTDYVLSAKVVGNRVEYFERMPDQLKGEILLTDNGAGPNRDSVEERVANTGNDHLTIDARMGAMLQVSKGTANTLDELKFQLGLERTGEVLKSKSDSLLRGWSREVSDAKKRIIKVLEEAGEVRVQPPGDLAARNTARSTRINRLTAAKSLIEKYEEALTGRWLGQNGIPSPAQIQQLIDSIRLQQLADREG